MSVGNADPDAVVDADTTGTSDAGFDAKLAKFEALADKISENNLKMNMSQQEKGNENKAAGMQNNPK